jgi:hypothetical protein
MFWVSGWLKETVESAIQKRPPTRAARRKQKYGLNLEELEVRIVPTLLGNQLFPSNYPTNNPITDAPVAANSSTVMAQIASHRSTLIANFSQENPTSSATNYGMQYNVVHGNATDGSVKWINVVIDNYADQSEVVPVPMPAVNGVVNPNKVFIEGDFQNGPNPNGAGYGTSPVTGGQERGDSHLIIYDVDNNVDYEFYLASRPGEVNDAGGIDPNNWHAASESVFKLNNDSFRTIGFTSGDAAGLPILPNLLRPDEALPTANGGQGVIDHALRFTLTAEVADNLFIYPAEHTTSSTGGTLPYGTRFRLENNATVDAMIAKMGPESQIIAKALQTYGLILADIGQDMFMQGASFSVNANNQMMIDPTTGSPMTWNMAGDIWPGIGSIPTTDFQIVDMTPQVTSLSTTNGPAGTMITINGVNFAGSAGHLQVLFAPLGGTSPGVASSAVTYISDTQLTAVVPTGESGTVDVRVVSGITGAAANDNVNGNGENVEGNAYPGGGPIFGYGISPTSSNDLFTYTSIGNSPPSITTQPLAQTLTAGQTVSFTAAASGSPSPTVQWQFSTNGGSTWSNISGATSTTYSFTSSTSQNGNEYRAVFTNSAGSATSTAATLTVNAATVAPSITTQPSNQTVTAGQSVSFTAAANGTPTPTVQWQVSTNSGSTWANISGATSTTYTFTSATSQTGGQYRAVFTNSAGTATTVAATLTVNVATLPPSITTQPSSQTVTAGQSATFSAGASGSPPPTVQWQVSSNSGSTWSNISGATATTFSFTTSTSQSGNQYRAVFTNSTGTAATNAATLTVNAATVAPSITTQPSSQTITTGQTVSFSAAASGTPTPTVQWQLSVSGGAFANISGATSSTYSFTAATSQSGNQYRAVFTNTAGTATSNAATLTVSTGSQTTTVTFQQGVSGYSGTQDAGIDTQYAIYNGGNGVNYVNQPQLLLGTDGSGSTFEGLVRFTSLGIPTNATVSSATLTLTIESWTGSASPITGYYVQNAWNPDSTLGWIHRGSGLDWATPGALGQGTDLVAGKSFSLTSNGNGPQTITINLDPAVVQRWIANPSADQGILLVNNAGNVVRLDTAENSTVSNRPVLQVTYSTGVVAGPSNTNLASSAMSAQTGQSVTFSATVTGGTGTPTGTVTFKDGTTTLGTASLSNGNATFSTSSLAVGTHSITAVYSGDPNFIGSTSAVLTETITPVSAPTTASFQQGVAGYAGTQDAGISTQYAVYNNGNGVTTTNQPQTLLGADGSGATFNGLVRFTNLGIPSNVVVSSATLSLTIESWSGTNTPITGYYLQTAWNATDPSLSWLQRGNGVTWASPGAIGQGTDVVAGKSFTLTANGSGPQTITADQGILLVNNAGGAVRLDLAENSTAGYRPQLQVTYKAAPANPSPTNITSLVKLTAPSAFTALGGGLSLGTFTLTNTSTQAINGSISVTFPSLPAGVTLVAESTVSGLAVNQSAQITLEFNNTQGYNLAKLLGQFPPSVLSS